MAQSRAVVGDATPSVDQFKSGSIQETDAGTMDVVIHEPEEIEGGIRDPLITAPKSGATRDVETSDRN